MRRPSANTYRLINYRYAALVTGSILVLVGIALIWWGAAYDHEVASVALSNGGAALVTAGLIGIVYDSVLKPRLLGDIKESLDLDANGIQSIAPISDLSVSKWPPAHRDVVLVVPDIRDWVNGPDWPYLCERSREVELSIKIYSSGSPDYLTDVCTEMSEVWHASTDRPTQSSFALYGRKEGTNQDSQIFAYRSGDVAMIGFDAPYTSYIRGSAIGIQLRAGRSKLWSWVHALETRVARDAIPVGSSGDGARSVKKWS